MRGMRTKFCTKTILLFVVAVVLVSAVVLVVTFLFFIVLSCKVFGQCPGSG